MVGCRNLINRDVWDITWILADPAMPLTMALQLAGTITLLVWQVGSAGLVGFAVLALLLLVSTRVVRRMNQQEQQLKKRQPGRAQRHPGGIHQEAAAGAPEQAGPLLHRAANAKRRQGWGCWAGTQGSMPSAKGLMLGTPLLVTLATFTTYLMSGNTSPCPRCSPPSPCSPCCASP